MAELAALMKCGRCQGWFIGDDALRAHYPCMPEDPDNGGGKPTALPLSKVLGHPTSVIRTTGARFSPADADLSSIESQEVADPRPAPPAVAPVIPEREYTMADLQHRQYSVTLQEEFGFVYPSVSHFSELALIERRRFFAWDCPIPSCLFLTNSHTSKKSTGTEPEQHQIAHMFLLLRTYTIYPPDKQNHEVAGRLYRVLDALKETVSDYLKEQYAKQLVIHMKQDERLVNPSTLTRFNSPTQLRKFLRSLDSTERFEANVKSILDNDIISNHGTVRQNLCDFLMRRYGFCQHPKNDVEYQKSMGASFRTIINDSLSSFRSSFLRCLRDKKAKYVLGFQQLDTDNHDPVEPAQYYQPPLIPTLPFGALPQYRDSRSHPGHYPQIRDRSLQIFGDSHNPHPSQVWRDDNTQTDDRGPPRDPTDPSNELNEIMRANGITSPQQLIAILAHKKPNPPPRPQIDVPPRGGPDRIQRLLGLGSQPPSSAHLHRNSAHVYLETPSQKETQRILQGDGTGGVSSKNKDAAGASAAAGDASSPTDGDVAVTATQQGGEEVSSKNKEAAGASAAAGDASSPTDGDGAASGPHVEDASHPTNGEVNHDVSKRSESPAESNEDTDSEHTPINKAAPSKSTLEAARRKAGGNGRGKHKSTRPGITGDGSSSPQKKKKRTSTLPQVAPLSLQNKPTSADAPSRSSTPETGIPAKADSPEVMFDPDLVLESIIVRRVSLAETLGIRYVDTDGTEVIIESITEKSPAARSFLQPQMEIIKVNGTRVSGPESVPSLFDDSLFVVFEVVATGLQRKKPEPITDLPIYRCDKHRVLLTKYQKILARELKHYSQPGRLLSKATCQGCYRTKDNKNEIVLGDSFEDPNGTQVPPQPLRTICSATFADIAKRVKGQSQDVVCFHFCGPCNNEYDELDEEQESKVSVLCSQCYIDYEEEISRTGNNTRRRKTKNWS